MTFMLWRKKGDVVFNGATPLTAGTLTYRNASTDAPLDVYSDSGGSSNLGPVVTLNGSGALATAVYVGETAFDEIIKDSGGSTIATCSDYPGSPAAVAAVTHAKPRTPVEVLSTASITLTSADVGQKYDLDPSGGDIAISLPSATTCTDGDWVMIRHNGTTGEIKVSTVSGQTLYFGSSSTVGRSLTTPGEEVVYVTDGAGWREGAHAPGGPSSNAPIIVIVDRLTAPPVSPNPGARYLMSGAPSGAWSARAQHDIAEYDGSSSWIYYRPTTDCGWFAYVQDENAYYSFQDSAWVESLRPATQAEQEAGSSTTAYVTPGRQHYHPGHPKTWAHVTVSGGTPTLATSYNVTSITDTAQGRLTVTIATDFSGTSWASLVTISGASGNETLIGCLTRATKAAGSIELRAADTSGTLQDPDEWNFAGMGDHA